MASLGELTAGIAHEIQNPLNFVNNFSEMSVELIEELKEERRKEKGERDEDLENELLVDIVQNLEKITHHGKRASSIVKGMLEHSRTSSGVKELTDINALADEYLRLSYHGLRAKNKSFNSDFKTDFAEDLSKVNVVSQDFGRVILNLINNAFYAVGKREKEGKETGESFKPMVNISTKNIDNQIVIKISDNGTGMPEAVKAKIFQPFFTTKPTGEGTGLGLSLAYDIVTKGHGGTIDVQSAENQGTEFTITLPIQNS
jgi:two-component system, NtrC family, sensor kinase